MAEILGTAPDVVSESSDVVSALPALNRQVRLAGLLIVLAVGVVPFLISSTLHVAGIAWSGSESYIVYRYLYGSLTEVTSLALLLYVLHQNGQALSDIGLRFQFGDLGYSIALVLGCRLVSRAARSVATWLYISGFGHAPPPFMSSLAGAGVVASLLFAVINPFFEELIVRAFLITEVTFLTGSVRLSVIFSVMLQTAYHLYQGIPNAVGAGFVFLVFSLYYVRTRRLWPVVIAHFWLDLSAVLYYLARTQHR